MSGGRFDYIERRIPYIAESIQAEIDSNNTKWEGFFSEPEWNGERYTEENLTIEEGQEREKYWIEFYKKQGKKLLNKASAGSIGTLGFKKRIQSYDRHE